MKLSRHEIHLLQHFFLDKPVKREYLFGSFTRNEASQDSDIDILVELDHRNPIGMKFFGFQIQLEELLHRKVDLIKSEGLSTYVKPFIEKDKKKSMKGQLSDKIRIHPILDAIQ